MSAGGERRAVVVSLVLHLLAAVAAFVGAAVTSSAAVLAGAVLAAVGAADQALVLLGERRAEREADDSHPFGYGRERWFWAFAGGLVLFPVAGALVLEQGVRRLAQAREGSAALEAPLVALGVLVVGVVLLATSAGAAVGAAGPHKGSMTWPRFLRTSPRPDLPLVLLEDLVGAAGLLLALLGVALADTTGDLVWDAVGALAVGVVLVVGAAVLAVEMRGLLLGGSATEDEVRLIRSTLLGGGVTSVIHLRTQQLGPDELLVGAKIALAPGATVEQVAAAIDAAEARVRRVLPTARVMYLEPDIPRAPGTADPAPAPGAPARDAP